MSLLDENGHTSRAISAHTYIQNIRSKIETLIKSSLKYYDSHPELDDSVLLEPEDHGIYRMLIGSAQWIISLGLLIQKAFKVLSVKCFL
jgi:hypothetical protein